MIFILLLIKIVVVPRDSRETVATKKRADDVADERSVVLTRARAIDPRKRRHGVYDVRDNDDGASRARRSREASLRASVRRVGATDRHGG